MARSIPCSGRGAAKGDQPDDARLISREPPPARASRDVYCYFDNTDKLHAPDNAAELMFKLGLRDNPRIDEGVAPV